MQKTICKKVYDTDTAALVSQRAFGNFGDPAGYEEKLYCTEEGLYFVYGIGGPDSPYPQETIKRLSKANAENWK